MIVVREIGLLEISLASTPENLLRTSLRRLPLNDAGGVLSLTKKNAKKMGEKWGKIIHWLSFVISAQTAMPTILPLGQLCLYRLGNPEQTLQSFIKI